MTDVHRVVTKDGSPLLSKKTNRVELRKPTVDLRSDDGKETVMAISNGDINIDNISTKEIDSYEIFP
jgi:hypothetical protein